jgi:hypothetical protein
MSESQHLSINIERPAAEVYAYLMNPENLPKWAAGLSGSIQNRDGHWIAQSPMGEIEVTFVPENPYFVADHDVKLSDGTTFNNPMRVIAHGTVCEVIFTLRRQPDRSEEEQEADAKEVRRDLSTLKELLES